jgi:hypothetical protein
MVKVVVYADTHNDEEYAEATQKALAKQKPEALFLEEGVKGKKGEYLFSAFKSNVKLAEIYSNCGINPSESSLNSEVFDTPVYELGRRQLMKAWKEMEKDFTKRESNDFKNIKAPEKVWINQEVDKAVYALRFQIKVRKTSNKSTLMSRVAAEAREIGFDLHTTDIEREKMYRFGAEEIDELPEDPEKVQKMFKKVHKGGGSYFTQQKINKMTKEFRETRDSYMAEDIAEKTEINGYSHIAAVVGKKHVEGVAEHLPEDFKVSEKDPTESGGFLSRLF